MLASCDTTGRMAFDAEQAVLDWWRGRVGLPAAAEQRAKAQGGYTETLHVAAVDLTKTVHMIEAFVGYHSPSKRQSVLTAPSIS